MRRAWRIIRWILLLLVLLPLVAGGGGYAYMARSLPVTSGTLTLAGLQQPVTVVRDAASIPHIFAQSRHDAFAALGYVHAQDRLWQMEFQRRIGQGRLSELFGEATLSIDRLTRTIGVYRAADSAWASFPAEGRAAVEAYIGGINTFLATHSGSRLPPEFSALGVRPEPWSGPDVLVWAKMMAFDMGGTFTIELLRSDLIAKVGPERAAELLPPSPADELSIVGPARVGAMPGAARVAEYSTPANIESDPRYGQLAAQVRLLRMLLDAGSPTGRGIGSNSWVVDGSKTTTGRPLLVNDPHLGANLPSIWYLAHLSAPDLDVIGASIPGLPGVVIGRNRTIAWGVTNLFPDVQDLVRERLDPGGQLADAQGRMEPMRIITETIAVKGAPPVEQQVRITRNGPLISDALNANQAAGPSAAPAPSHEALALRWTALDPDDPTVAAFLRVNSARNWQEFTGALAGYIAPAQNFVYADVDGNIGYYGAGRFPIRRSGDGTLPVEGWTGAGAWDGWVPADAVPQLYNPPSHMIVTANNRPVGAGYPYLLGTSWDNPYRAQRITTLLEGSAPLSPADMARFQNDTVSLQARELLPLLLQLVTPQDDRQRAALDLLHAWDGDMGPQSVPAAIYAAWFRRLPYHLVSDELGSDLAINYEGWMDLFVSRFLVDTLSRPDSPWCDVAGTSQREDCRAAAQTTLAAALDDLRERLGEDPQQWRWERLHTVRFSHQPFGEDAMLRLVFSRSAQAGGDHSTINVGAFVVEPAFEQYVAASYRQVIDLSSSDQGQFILAIGQSGHVLSPHYDDYLADWQAGRYHPMVMTRGLIEQPGTAILQLVPATP